MAYKYLNDDGLKAYTKKVKTAIAKAIAEVKLYFTTQKVTWSELKALRDAKKLVAGKTYRITDFVTTSVQAETRSAGHAFDLLVVADDEGTLNENARAILHNGDTYFKDCKLNAWELKYCLDNDTNRFAWADATNGKGVVWWMKDEWDNECYYDFKNIQYKRYECITLKYGNIPFSDYMASGSDFETYNSFFGVANDPLWDINVNNFAWCYTFNNFKNNDTAQPIDMSIWQGDFDTDVEPDLYWLSFTARDNHIGASHTNIQIDDNPMVSVLQLPNILATCYDIDDIYNWTYDVINNRIGEDCHDITFARKCKNITCGNNCNSWTCGNGCYSWTCGNDCSSWTCGNNCNSWTCGNDCSSWTCGNNCYSWTCGNDCSSWTCGNNCYSWTCGNNCYSWTCGNNCYSWTCGNDCSSWTCGNEVSNTKVLQDYVSYFHLDDGVSNITIKSSGTPTYDTPLKNFVVKAGVKGTSTNTLAIVIDVSSFPLNSDYEWTIAKNSSGVIKQYCEADLIN